MLEVETLRTPEAGWQVTARLVAQAEGVDPMDAGAIVSQVSTDGRGWRTLGRFQPGSEPGPLGLGALHDQGRMVFPPGYRLDQVVTDLRSNGQDYSLSQAAHSRAGNLSLASLAGGESVDLRLGDTVTLNYGPSAAGPTSATGWYFLIRPGTGVVAPATSRPELSAAAPRHFALHAIRPNPFRGFSAIRFDLPEPSSVRLEVFDLQGRLVRTLVAGTREPGDHTVEWNGKDGGGKPVPAGVYQCRIQAGDFRARRAMVLLP